MVIIKKSTQTPQWLAVSFQLSVSQILDYDIQKKYVNIVIVCSKSLIYFSPYFSAVFDLQTSNNNVMTKRVYKLHKRCQWIFDLLTLKIIVMTKEKDIPTTPTWTMNYWHAHLPTFFLLISLFMFFFIYLPPYLAPCICFSIYVFLYIF